ncbi:MAG: N-acetyltransferase [Deltaproteobacteria bacterium]|nr:N-acetyltransferase [Deltaproteobacteria bacterium]MBW2447048.1 N-acetyltransferase [Deltaproteobacteria bacterium]
MFEVRTERPGDEAAVFTVQNAAFGQTDEARLVDAMRGSVEPAVSLVATRGDAIVGHVFVSPVTLDTEPGATDLGGLAPLGVVPDLQGRGAGGELVRAALEASQGVGFRAVFLLGSPVYYGRFGFEPAAPLGFHYQSEAFDEHFQQLELEPGALSGRAGFVRYCAAFGGGG